MLDVEIIPGINEKALAGFRRKVELVAPHVTWVQIDFMDGTLVPASSFFDIEAIGSVIAEYPKLSFEAHLMVAKPEKYVSQLASAGFKRLIAHVEAMEPRLFLEETQYESVETGIAIDADTEFDMVEPFLDEVDSVLVMTVEAGASGQQFMPETVEKIQQIRENLPDLPIEVDGGINEHTAHIVKDIGVTRLVSTSFLFDHPQDISKHIGLLKQA